MQLIQTDRTETLPRLIERATDALANAKTSAEVLEARDMARVAYDAAKSAARMAQAKEAHDSILADVHRAQGHALAIRSRAEMRLAEEYDAAQERGEVAGDGRPKKTVGDDNGIATASDLGLRRDEIYEARRLRDAEAADPGVIERTVNDMVDRGEEPTRAALRRQVIEAAKFGGRPSSNRNPLYRPDAERDAVICFTGNCRSVAETENVEALLAFDGDGSFRRQMIDQAIAAHAKLSRFLDLAGE